MNAVARFAKATSVPEALDALCADPSARWLAGGTLLLAGDSRDKPESVIDVSSALPRGIVRADGEIVIGAGATFQDIADAAVGPKEAPPFLAEAALTMVNRNTRNRATIGGNLGADKSCSSLIPILLALEAFVELVSLDSPEPSRMTLEEWLRRRETEDRGSTSDLVLRIVLPVRTGVHAMYRRWNRVSCDLSVLGAAVAYELADGKIRGLRLALGGLGPKARRFPELETLFEGKVLPDREEIESTVRPFLHPIDDLRASAAFKRLRGAQLLADALLDAADRKDACA